MKLLDNKAPNIQDIAQNWKEVNEPRANWLSWGKEIHERLIALGDNPDREVVTEILNDWWSREYITACSECGVYAPVIELSYDYESPAQCICEPCLTKALALFYEEKVV